MCMTLDTCFLPMRSIRPFACVYVSLLLIGPYHTIVDADVADWDAVLGFIRENDAYDMLEKRISKVAVRGYIDATKAVPPGVNYGTKLEVNIRKPVARVED